MDVLEATLTLDAAMFSMHVMANRNGANWDWATGEGTEYRVTAADSVNAYMTLKAIIQANRILGKSSSTEKKFLKEVKVLLQEYFQTLSRDEQIIVLKQLNKK